MSDFIFNFIKKNINFIKKNINFIGYCISLFGIVFSVIFPSGLSELTFFASLFLLYVLLLDILFRGVN